MTWDDFWAFYTGCESEIQQDLLNQIQLTTLIKATSPRVQQEILFQCPKQIQKPFLQDLDDDVLKKLGYFTSKQMLRFLGG